MTKTPIPPFPGPSDPVIAPPAPTHPLAAIDADEMGCASFPASDPPATWTWDPR